MSSFSSKLEIYSNFRPLKIHSKLVYTNVYIYIGTLQLLQMKQDILCILYVWVCGYYLTSGVSAKDEFSDLIVNKDEETVRERTEPPAGPEREQGGDDGQ